MKKGLLYIDWSISVGIFIIYLVTIFVFVSPSLAKDYSEEYLKTIARSGFEEKTYHTLSIYPIFIKHTIPDDAIFILSVPSNIQPLDNPSKVGIFYFDGSSLVEITDSEVSPNSITFIPQGMVYDGAVNTYYMIISDYEEGYVHNNPGTGISPESYAFGIPELIRSLSSNKFADLQALSYEDIKRELKYPLTKDIAINVYSGTNLDADPILSIVPDIAAEKDVVYVMQWSAWKISKNYDRELVTISIETW